MAAKYTVKNRLPALFFGMLFALVMLELGLRIAGSFYTAHKPPDHPRDSNVFAILCIGDSFVYGLGAPANKSYPAQLEEIMNQQGVSRPVKVINDGFPGENTTQIRERFVRSVDVVKPDLVIFLGGLINEGNYYGYHAFLRSDSIFAGIKDQCERIRIWKLIKLLLLNARGKPRKPAAPSLGHDSQEMPDNKYYSMAVREFTNDKRQQAIAFARQSIAADPHNVKPYALMGNIFSKEGKTADAIACFKKYLEVEYDKAVSHELGNILQANGHTQDAFLAYKQGMEREPSSANYCLDGLIGLLQIGDDDLSPETLRAIRRFLREISRVIDEDGKIIIENALQGSNIRKSIDSWRTKDITSIVDVCRQRGIPVILMDYPEEESVIKPLAAVLSVPFVENAPTFKELLQKEPRSKYFSADANHCNAAGYRIMAGNVYDKIIELGLLQ